ncbi:MAG: response regulator [Ghiorsea sp.]
MRILVTDDSGFLRRITCKLVQGLGFETIEAVNGEDCLLKLAEEKPDCLLLDFIMPELDGFEVLRRLQSKQNIPPIVVLSADIQDVVRQECLGLGAAAFLNKPPKLEEIEKVLSDLFGQELAS